MIYVAIVNPKAPYVVAFVSEKEKEATKEEFARAWEQAIRWADSQKPDWGLDEIVMEMAPLGFKAVRSFSIIGERNDYGAWLSKIKDGWVILDRPETGETEKAFRIGHGRTLR